MYAVIATISLIIRQFIISNPFEVLGEGITLVLDNSEILITPEVLNWIVEPAIHAITFAVVGIHYEVESFPALGSILYLVFYWVHVWLIRLMALSGFSVGIVLLIAILYIAIHFALLQIKNIFFTFFLILFSWLFFLKSS